MDFTTDEELVALAASLSVFFNKNSSMLNSGIMKDFNIDEVPDARKLRQVLQEIAARYESPVSRPALQGVVDRLWGLSDSDYQNTLNVAKALEGLEVPEAPILPAGNPFRKFNQS